MDGLPMAQPAGQNVAAIPPNAGFDIGLTHDVTLVTTRKLKRARVLGVPPEEFGIERGARSIKDCNYCFHDVVTKTEGQLIAEGFDEAQIKGLTTYAGQTDIETTERDTVEETSSASSDLNSGSRLVRITEHYVRMDYEGTGRPCLYQVITGGEQGEILRKDGKECIEPFDAMPFAATTPVPVTHRFFGRSIADLIMPLQREKTAMKRGALDNMYLANNPRPMVAAEDSTADTIDDLLLSRHGAPVRTKRQGGVQFATFPNITANIFGMMQYLDAEMETRSGVSKQSQGIDANALQNQSATAVAQVFSASQMRIKLVARIMAEGVRDIFSLLHGTIRKHGQQKQTVRLRNAWVDVNPRDWKTRDDMTINVGLGSGSKAQQFAQTIAIANVQKEMLAGGKSHMVGDSELFNTAAELTRIMGHKNPDRFFKDPNAKGPDGQPLNPPAPPPVDPKLEAIKLKAANDRFALEQKAAIEKLQAEADIAVQRQKAESEIQLAREQADLKAKLMLLEAGIDAQARALEPPAAAIASPENQPQA